MWQRKIDVNGIECHVNFDEGIVVYLLESALKHQSDSEVLEMFCGDIEDRIVKPSIDINAGSILDIVSYRGISAELGRNFVDYAYDDIDGVPQNFEVFDVFHAFCAKMGYYHYADFPVDSTNGITDSWYDIMDFYHEGGFCNE